MWEGKQLQDLDPYEILQCQEILDGALKHGLLMEVVESAFKHKHLNPDASLLESLLEGAMEWDL